MTNFFLSAEFIRRLRVVNWRVVLPHDRKFERQRRSAALQSNRILGGSKQLFANRFSLLFWLTGASPSNLPTDSKSVSTERKPAKAG